MSTVTVGNIELYYEEHGSGEPLLLIMGLAADSMAWMFQLPAFAERYRTIVFDNRGVGRSSKPAGPYTIPAMADDTAGLLEAIGIEHAHVVGVSMGGMIAQELALRHRQRVRGLVLACTYPEPDDDIRLGRSSSIAQLGGSVGADGAAALDLATVDPMMIFQTLLPKVFSPTFLQNQLPILMQLFGGALQWGFSVEAIMAQVDAVMSHKATDRLSSIQAPTLVITGDSDLLSPPANSDLIASKIPGARLVKIPGGTHGFNFETPDVFNRAIIDFLATVHA
jgi:pimeloyl-ACP methyl ester carboxylesterase